MAAAGRRPPAKASSSSSSSSSAAGGSDEYAARTLAREPAAAATNQLGVIDEDPSFWSGSEYDIDNEDPVNLDAFALDPEAERDTSLDFLDEEEEPLDDEEHADFLGSIIVSSEQSAVSADRDMHRRRRLGSAAFIPAAVAGDALARLPPMPPIPPAAVNGKTPPPPAFEAPLPPPGSTPRSPLVLPRVAEEAAGISEADLESKHDDGSDEDVDAARPLAGVGGGQRGRRHPSSQKARAALAARRARKLSAAAAAAPGPQPVSGAPLSPEQRASVAKRPLPAPASLRQQSPVGTEPSVISPSYSRLQAAHQARVSRRMRRAMTSLKLLDEVLPSKPEWGAQELLSVRTFFDLVHQRIRPATVLLTTRLPTHKTWLAKSQVKFGSRGKLVLQIDAALAAHNAAVTRLVDLLHHSRIVIDGSQDASAGGTQSTIDFAFPGFEQQTFQVGQTSVISPWDFFRNASANSFSDDTWQGAIKSRSVAKELMQASPDVTQYYEAGEKEKGRRILHFSSLSILHNLALAAHVRKNCASFKRGPEGSVISWPEVTHSAGLKDHVTGEPVVRNQAALEVFDEVYYLYHPSLDEMLQLVHGSEDGHKADPATVRTLLDPIEWLAFTILVVRQRVAALCQLVHATTLWLEAKNPLKKAKSQRRKAVLALESGARTEIKQIWNWHRKMPKVVDIYKAMGCDVEEPAVADPATELAE